MYSQCISLYLLCNKLPQTLVAQSIKPWSSRCGAVEMHLRGTMRLWVRSLASPRGLRIWSCCELWCRSPMQLGSGMAVAVAKAGGCSSD